MAALTRRKDTLFEPSPRFDHQAIAIGHQVYQYGGYTQSLSLDKPSRQVDILDSYTERWRPTTTTGLSLPGVINGGTVLLHGDVFHYGGYDDRTFHGGLYRLQPADLRWECVDSCNGDGAPMKKSGCRIIITGDNSIGVLGGFGLPPSFLQPGSTFIKSGRFRDGRGFTNEFHVFNLTPGTWSSPTLTGDRPPPSTSFTLVNMTKYKAVYFGGYQPGHGRVNDLYLIDLNTMECTKIEPQKGEPWPVARSSHTACCLNYGDESPQLLITCGVDKGDKALNDAWIWDFSSRKWKELTLPAGMRRRYGHSATAITLGPGLVEVTMFGGYQDNFPTLADTTIMRFESIEKPSSGGKSFTKEYVLVDVATSSQRGTSERLRKKMVSIASKAKEMEGDSTLPPVNVDSEVTFSSLSQLEETTDIPVTASTEIVPWMAKHYNSHPTWRQLVQYLREINMVQLIEQIEDFIFFSTSIGDGLRLRNIILAAVLNGLTAPIERAVQIMKQHPIISEAIRRPVLDFIPHKGFTNVPPSQMSHSPLMIACGSENKEMVGTLLQLGASKGYKNKEEVTALHIACGTGNLELVQDLLKGEALDGQFSELLLSTDKNGLSILHYASTCSGENVIQLLERLLSDTKLRGMLNHMTHDGYTPLLMACQSENEPVVKYLLEQPEVETSLRVESENKETTKDGFGSGLHIAAIHDSPVIAELLINKGCPIDLQDTEGNTALHIAYKKSSTGVIDVLRRARDGERLETIRNKAGKLPKEIPPENIIPPEILKLGKAAIHLYKKALTEGKEKIPRCNLMLLGEKRVGKTSVYRLLVLLGFDPEQISTHGIDNTVIDVRQVDIEEWKEKKESDDQDLSDQLFTQGVAGALSEYLPESEPEVSSEPQVSSESLFAEIEKIKIAFLKAQHHVQHEGHDESSPSSTPKMLELHDDALPRCDQQLKSSAITTSDDIVSDKLPSEQSVTTFLANTPQTTASTLPSHGQGESTKPESLADNTQDQPHAATPVTGSESTAEQLRESSPSVQRKKQDKPSEEKQQGNSEKNLAPSPKLSSRHANMINKHLQSTRKGQKRSALLLTTLDFAGQHIYRPMHHCFIRRRSIYMVVFNLQKMRMYVHHKEVGSVSISQLESNPLEEVRYWIHSINAHIYSREGDERVKRICLVGTHKAPPNETPLSEEDLDKINQLFKKELYSDTRCANHLHFMGPSNGNRIFAAVENSIDGKDPMEREKSGAKALQEELKAISQKLPFLDEDYPLIWLRFESELVRRRDSLKQRKNCQVVHLEEVRRLATQCGIFSTESQDLALKFLHEIGQIIFLQEVPTLFLTSEEMAELACLVVLDPAWLTTVMNSIVEVDGSSPFEGQLIRRLTQTGIVSDKLLEEFWSHKDLLHSPITCHQLCLILKAYCLIHPISCLPYSASALSLTEQETKSCSGYPKKPSFRSSRKSAKTFLVPCKLPKTSGSSDDFGFTFFFDFFKFLPEEIFHRLICLMLAAFEATNPSRKQKGKLFLSDTRCEFNFSGCQWRVELERSEHRLKVSVHSNSKDKTQHITAIHTKHLLRICQESNFPGLEYYGGPLVQCESCGETEVLEFVGYVHRVSQPSSSRCSTCGTIHDVNQLLTNQVIHQPTLRDLLRELQSKIAHRWEDIGIQLGLEQETLSIVKANERDVRDCLREMLKIWLQRVEPPPSWPSIIQAIEVVGDQQLASYLRHKYC